MLDFMSVTEAVVEARTYMVVLLSAFLLCRMSSERPGPRPRKIYLDWLLWVVQRGAHKTTGSNPFLNSFVAIIWPILELSSNLRVYHWVWHGLQDHDLEKCIWICCFVLWSSGSTQYKWVEILIDRVFLFHSPERIRKSSRHYFSCWHGNVRQTEPFHGNYQMTATWQLPWKWFVCLTRGFDRVLQITIIHKSGRARGPDFAKKEHK